MAVLATDAAPPEPRPAASKAVFPLTVDANLMVDQDVFVTTRVTGVVEVLHAERGDLVRKGQPLAELDTREFELDRRAAEETLAVSRADFERYRELRAQNLASEAEFEQRRSQFELARVEAERARLVIDRSVVRAPFDGVVVERHARVGQKVLLAESVPLFRVAALEPLLARVYLPEAAFRGVRVGEEVEVVTALAPQTRSVGKVTFLSPVIDPASGAIEAVVKVRRDPARVLRPGMAVKVTFAGHAPP